MIGIVFFLVVGLLLIMAGLYNLGAKARRLEQTDEEFFQSQLLIAKQECYKISQPFSRQLAIERERYLHDNMNGSLGYSEWMSKGVESFFKYTVSPKLVDVQRECLIQFGAYPEIIDEVAVTAQEQM